MVPISTSLILAAHAGPLKRNGKPTLQSFANEPACRFTLDHVRKNCEKSRTVLLLSAVLEQPYNALCRSGQLDAIGKENISDDLDDALVRAKELLGQITLPSARNRRKDRRRRRRRTGQAA